MEKSPLFFDLDKTIAHLFSEDPEPVPTSTGVPHNSNEFAIGPSRTSDGGTYLDVNSHQPYTGPVAWYEAHVHSDEGWDMVGGTFPASPLIIHGHNRDLGWAFTVNTPDLTDVYRLTINPENPDQYLFDGQWRDLEGRQAKLKVKLIGNLVPFAHRAITEISCHCRGAQWFVPGVSTVLDVGGQDSKGIRVGASGEVADFVMNDKCAGGTGRLMEIVAEVLHVPLSDIGPLSLQSTKDLPLSTLCAAYGRGAAVTLLKQGERKEDILAGLHEAITSRVTALIRKVGIADKFVITGGIGRNVGLVSKIEQKLAGLKVTLPEEPMIAGALGAALFALDQARKKAADRSVHAYANTRPCDNRRK